MVPYVALSLFTFMLNNVYGDGNTKRVTLKMKPHSCISEVDGNNRKSVINYLSKYGYFRGPDKYKHDMKNDTYSVGIRKFQAFILEGFDNITSGEVDEETLKWMNKPRFTCGSEDIISKLGIFPRRKKRFVLQGSKWRNGNITYRITKYPSNSTKMSNSDVDKEIRKAFNLWSESANLKFIYKRRGRVHMNISFQEGEHGDDDDFDGYGGVLAHGYFPVYGGDTHFDDGEEWVRNGDNGTGGRTAIDLYITAAHEIGHALGLSHSRSRKSLMAPYYKGYNEDLELDMDDVEGIQKLYGPNPLAKGKKVNGEPQRCLRKDCDLCDNVEIDTVVNHAGSVFVFSGDFYWKLQTNSTEVAPGYPRKISESWDGLPGNLDASFTWKNGKTFFLKGSQLWRLSNGKLDKGFPREISKALPGIPNDVSAAFYWPLAKSVYFFKGNEYWEFNPRGKPRIGSSFPAKNITDIPGFPESIDAAVEFFNGRIYVFSDHWYYRIKEDEVSLDTNPGARHPFPRRIRDRWFSCKPKPDPRKPALLEQIKISGLD